MLYRCTVYFLPVIVIGHSLLIETIKRKIIFGNTDATVSLRRVEMTVSNCFLKLSGLHVEILASFSIRLCAAARRLHASSAGNPLCSTEVNSSIGEAFGEFGGVPMQPPGMLLFVHKMLTDSHRTLRCLSKMNSYS
jgi:hypothetical protein